jgi:hypothetical protein
MKRGERFTCMMEEEANIWGIKGCGEIKSIKKYLIGGKMVVENG